MWVQRPDPAPDELMQADVLSQMAIGELCTCEKRAQIAGDRRLKLR